MNDIFFIPLKDELYPNPWNMRITVFRFGPMFVAFTIKDRDKMDTKYKKYVDNLRTFDKKPLFSERFLITATVNEDRNYCIASFKTEEECWAAYNIIIDSLKRGEEIELTDFAGYSFPMKLSYKGIQWIW